MGKMNTCGSSVKISRIKGGNKTKKHQIKNKRNKTGKRHENATKGEERVEMLRFAKIKPLAPHHVKACDLLLLGTDDVVPVGKLLANVTLFSSQPRLQHQESPEHTSELLVP